MHALPVVACGCVGEQFALADPLCSARSIRGLRGWLPIAAPALGVTGLRAPRPAPRRERLAVAVVHSRPEVSRTSRLRWARPYAVRA